MWVWCVQKNRNSRLLGHVNFDGQNHRFVRNGNKTEMVVLSVADVISANDHCMKFMKNRITFDSGFSPLTTIANDFVLLIFSEGD